MKTAMQELIVLLKEYADSTENLRVKQAYLNSICAIEDFKLIEKEKQQIINAYCNAEDKSEYFEYEHRYGREYLTAEPYYNETYENNL